MPSINDIYFLHAYTIANSIYLLFQYRIIPTFGFVIEKDKKIENDPYSITGRNIIFNIKLLSLILVSCD